MKKNFLFTTALTLFSLFLLTEVAAQVYYNEDFSSAANGDRLSSGTGGGNGFGGWNSNSSNCAQGGFCSISCNWYTVVSTALTSPVSPYQDSPKSVLLTAGVEGPGRCFNTSFTPNMVTGDEVYVGVLVKFTSCPDNNGSAKGDFIRLISGPFAVFARIGANGNGGVLKFRVGADGNAFPVETSGGTPYSFNQTYFLVLKYKFIPGGTDQVRLFVNPPSTGEPTAADAVVNSSGINTDPTTFKGIQFNGLNAVTTSGIPSGNVGGIRVAHTWAELFAVIPAEMTNFDATPKGKTNLLSWATATEINVSHFEVEKSMDGESNWTKIGESKAAGTSVAENKYRFVDENPYSVSYYRIKTKDLDRSEAFSKVVSVKQDIAKGSFKVYPQPVGDVATIQLESTKQGKAIITVLDASGRLVLTQNAAYTEGSNNLTFSTQNLASGLYLIHLNDGITTTTASFVKR
jgi:Secretion system C-terminal sorting domain